MDRIISPPASEWETLRQPLTLGEKAVLKLFCETLAPEWEIYIQPHLNGLRPDFVLLHPHVGIAVYEVKDWNLDALDYFVKKNGRHHELWASKDGKDFRRERDNPVRKVERYREAIYNLYCPRLQAKKGIAAVTGGVIFPYTDVERLKKLFGCFLPNGVKEGKSEYFTLAGIEDIENGRIGRILPAARYSSSKLMRPELAADLRGWLVEPDFSREQREPLPMDAKQLRLAESRTKNGLRRIKGPAGSGKSLVLAARAAKLADEGKSVLVVTFNITLGRYLRDLTVRAIERRSSLSNVIFDHFHSWCKDVCWEVGWSGQYEEVWSSNTTQNALETCLPALAQSAAVEEGAPRYDAILVDEGQDYRPSWWQALRAFLHEDGEMLLVADSTQDIYGTAKSWTDEAMAGAGFAGSWATLSVSYRLPPATIPIIRRFAETFLADLDLNLPEPQQGELHFAPCRLRWVQCEPDQATPVCLSEIMRLMHFTGDGHANADMTLLASDIDAGRQVTEALASHQVKTVATFAEDEKERRREKFGFWMGDARLKATTLHSFKGWESPLLVVDVRQAAGQDSLALMYTGLTRLRHSSAGSRLTVISSCPELLDYGRTWPNFVMA